MESTFSSKAPSGVKHVIESPNFTYKQTKVSAKLRIRHYFAKYFIEYCDSTSIHGVQYFGGSGRAKYERIIWVLIFCLSLLATGFLIRQTYFKWKSSMILVGTAQRPVSVWDIPFPSVTMCPETKYQRKEFDLAKQIRLFEAKDFDKMNKKKIALMKLVCPIGLSKFDDEQEFFTEDHMTQLKQASPKFNTLFDSCIWRNTYRPCAKLFKKIPTVEGVCYTFNMLSQTQLFSDNVIPFEIYKNEQNIVGWNMKSGYNSNFKINDTYPMRDMFLSKKSTDDFGLILLLALSEDDLDYNCGGQQGFRIYLHHPGEYPEIGQKYFFLSLKTNLHISLKPSIMTSDEEMESFTPDVRNCYYPGEKLLMFYKVYTQRNCELECLANYTLKKCNCVAFYMPHMTGTNICGPAKSTCVQLAREKNMAIRESITFKDDTLEQLLADEFKDADAIFGVSDQLNSTNQSTIIEPKEEHCNCRPECDYVQYDGEETIHEFDFVQATMVQSIAGGKRQYSKLTVQYDKNKVIPSERKVFFRFVDFVASVGGLLGLFTGFSTLSAFELIYHLSIRLLCNVKTQFRRPPSMTRLDFD